MATYGRFVSREAAPTGAAAVATIRPTRQFITNVFGPEVGAHARSAVGLFELPFGIPVEVEAEVEIAR